MNLLLQRRSIRKYTGQPVSEENVRQILKAGMYAPSAGNGRPWQFIVVRDSKKLVQLSELSPYSKMTASADVAIVICGDTRREKFPSYWVQDCSAATQNILLEITRLNLGGVWLGVHPREDRVKYIREMFQLPDYIHPLAVVPIGHPAEEKEMPERFEEQLIHYEDFK